MPRARPCGQCGAAYYCSDECQQADWPVHSLLCRDFNNQSSRPGANWKRAIYFPPNTGKPSFIWIECTTHAPTDEYEDCDDGWEEPEMRNWLGNDKPHIRYLPMEKNVARGRRLPSSIKIAYRDAYLHDGSAPNRSIKAAIRGAYTYDWRGPMVAMKNIGESALDESGHLDMDLHDFRDAVDYFIAYDNADYFDEKEDQLSAKIKGFRVSNDGSQLNSSGGRFIEVDVPKEHQVFSVEDAPSIAGLVGLPVQAWKYSLSEPWMNSGATTVSANPYITSLFLGSDPDFTPSKPDPLQGSWGSAPPQWHGDIGTILVVRSDGMDLSRHEVEALCTFCLYQLQPLFESSNEAGLAKEEILAQMKPQVFKQYFEMMRRERFEDASWRAATLHNV